MSITFKPFPFTAIRFCDHDIPEYFKAINIPDRYGFPRITCYSITQSHLSTMNFRKLYHLNLSHLLLVVLTIYTAVDRHKTNYQQHGKNNSALNLSPSYKMYQLILSDHKVVKQSSIRCHRQGMRVGVNLTVSVVRLAHDTAVTSHKAH